MPAPAPVLDAPPTAEAPLALSHWIDGQPVPSRSGRTFEVLEPATGHVLATAPEGRKEDVAAAVAAAKRAFPAWARTPAPERAARLLRLAELVLRDVDEIARLEARDVGKPIALARDREVPRAAHNLAFFADYVKTLGTEAYEAHDRASINVALRRPVGVAGLITPWNLPLLLTTWKLAPALAAGNTAVVKPAELTPVTATRLAALAAEAGLPDGVLNVVHGFGPDAAGSALVEHPDVPLLSLTGETSTGQAVMRAASTHLKKLSLELGGKNPVVVFADADLDRAIETTLRSSFTNQGEVCLCGSRIYVERPVFEEFSERLAAGARALRVGDPLAEDTQMGALVSAEHLARVHAYLDAARDDGGTFLAGGDAPTLPAHLAGGNWLAPTVITGLDDACRTVREEVFGPVVTVSPFDTEEEAVRRANDTPYGLAAILWTSDLSRGHRVSAALEAGIVWVNTWFLRDLRTPFGGVKGSGIGREGGVHSFEFYTELKNVCIQL